jgi:hypothetical protein
VADRFGTVGDAELERALVDLGANLDYPRLPAVAVHVRQRLERELAPPPVREVLRPYRPLRRSLVLATLGLLLVAGAATAALFRIRGVEIRTPSTPSAVPSPVPTATDSPDIRPSLGEEVTLREARQRVPFRVRLPSLPDVGSPNEIYVDDDPSGGRVTALYGPRPSLPATSTTGVGLLITLFQAGINEEFVVKEAGPDTRVEQVSVSGAPGYWVEGEPHVVLYVDDGGNPFPDTVRLAGNTLLWERDGVTFRLEADISKQAALRIAASFR